MLVAADLKEKEENQLKKSLDNFSRIQTFFGDFFIYFMFFKPGFQKN